MDFSSSSSTGSGSRVSPDEVMDQLRTQINRAFTQELFETVHGKCFDKCITKPGSSLSGSESSCAVRCFDRYIEATGIIARTLFSQKN